METGCPTTSVRRFSLPKTNFDPGGRRAEIFENSENFLDESLRNLSRIFLIRGIVAAAIGLAALFWPADSVSFLLRLVGLLILVDGAITLLGFGMRTGSGPERISGFATLLVGIVLVLLPTTSARIAFLLIGLWVVVRGISYLAVWWRSSQIGPEREAARNAGIVNLLIGVALALWPGTGLVALGWVIAFSALLIAAVMFFFASRIGRGRQSIRKSAS
jgi:uncharacterized membrane protein HdeD (DUF308 family)